VAAEGRTRIVSIVGTRPEAIKMAPVVREIAARRSFSQQLVLTGQHSGLAPMFDGIAPQAICELAYDPRGRTAAKLRESLHRILCGHLQRQRADLVLVHGDTTSAFAGALAAYDCGIPVGHVEAGLRSFDYSQPWPEEGNRTAIDALSALLFAPTDAAARNLRGDWRVTGEILVTGNTVIDALLHTVEQVREERDDESPTPGGAAPFILVTCHRKENQGERLAPVCEALKRIARELPVEIAFPLHLNRHVRHGIEAGLGGTPGIRLIEPLGYREMVRLMDSCRLILTDSGGLQEEGPALGKPVLVLRSVTERPEAVATANVELVGTDPERIFGRVRTLLEDADEYGRMARPSFPFGDGHASPRIVDAIAAWSARRRQSLSRDAVRRFATIN
jgi:UDP-N-acetylglucosamine 2-epimerase